VARVPAGIEDMIPGYLDNRRKELAELRALADAVQHKRIAEIAHRMIGVGTPYGFVYITEQARVLKRAAEQADNTVIKRVLEELATYLQRVKIETE